MSTPRRFRVFAVALFFALVIGRAVYAEEAGAPVATPFDFRPAITDERSVTSAEYQTYLQTLQAAGSPEQTIHAIVTADVLAAFAGKRTAALAERYQNFAFWKCEPAQTAARAKLSAQRRVIDEEMNGVLQQLLGPATELPDVNQEWTKNALDFELSFLTPAQREAVKVTLLTYAKSELQIKELGDGDLLDDDTNELQQILDTHQQVQATLQRLLSAEEYQQVEMTVSVTAENLRHAMVHFNPTEAEFRIIFNAWRPHDEALAQIYAHRETDPGNGAIYAKIKEQLPPERYETYRSTWWK
jgi:hypothetical protein